MLVTPTTVALSVMRTLTSLPSRDFTVSNEPSKASIVPRTRTVGGCCADAPNASTDMSASEATSARGIIRDSVNIVCFLEGFSANNQNTAARALFRGGLDRHAMASGQQNIAVFRKL